MAFPSIEWVRPANPFDFLCLNQPSFWTPGRCAGRWRASPTKSPNGERVEIFGHGGGRAEAERRQIPFLGEIPIYTEIRLGGDSGVPVVVSHPDQPFGQAFVRVAELLRQTLG